MTDKLKESVLFIELDALLDTRLAVLAQMDGDALEKAIKHKYHERAIDQFPEVDNTLFSQRYAARDKQVLKDTMITPMGELMREFAEKTLKQIITTPFHYQPKVIVNTFPYLLEETEAAAILDAVVAITKGHCDVELVHMSYEDVTPLYVKKNLSILILYDCYKWLETHSENGKLKSITCPEVTLLGPRIYFKMKERATDDDQKAFKAMEELAAPLIGLRLIPIENFSLVLRAGNISLTDSV